MTEKTARAEDAAAAPEASTSADPAAQQQSDPVAVAAELRDRLLRTLAEMENLRKRTEREVTDARLYGGDVASPATCWALPTICAAHLTRCRRSCARAPSPASRR